MAELAYLRGLFVYVWPAVALTPWFDSWLTSLSRQWQVAVRRLLAASLIADGHGGLDRVAAASSGGGVDRSASSSRDLPFPNWLGADPLLPAIYLYLFLAAGVALIWFVTGRELGLPMGRRRRRWRLF